MSRSFDLLVIGGGPAGTATALAARARGLTVVLVEAGRLPIQKVCGEFVSDAGMSAWRRLTGCHAHGAPRLATAAFRVSGGSSGPVARFPLDPPAWGLRREVLDGALLEACSACGVDVRLGTRAGAPERSGSQWRVPLRGSESVVARRVVSAAGRRPVAETGSGWFGLKGSSDTAAPSADIEIVLLPDGSYYGLCGVDSGETSLCALSRHDRAPWAADPERAGDSIVALRGTPRFGTGYQPAPPDGVFSVGDALAAWPPLVGDGITSALLGGVLLGNSLGMDDALTSAEWQRRWSEHFGGALRRALAWHALLRRPGLRHGLVVMARGWPGLAARLARATRHQACPCPLCRVPEPAVEPSPAEALSSSCRDTFPASPEF